MTPPRISVQIPVKDGGGEFRRCLQSLREQESSGFNWELIIVDDGSEEPVEDSFDLDFPANVSVRVIRMEKGGNRPAARNAAWKRAEAPVSFLTDGDILFSPDILRRHLEAHDSGGWDAVMGARVNSWMEDSTPWQEWFDTRGMGGRPAGEFPGRYFVTGNLSIKTCLLESSGGFDPAIDKYGGEDTELGFRLERQGARMYWDPHLRVDHLDDVTVRMHSRKMVEYGGSGLRYTLEKIPEASGLLGSDWLKPILAHPRSPSTVFMRLLSRVMLLPPVYRLVLVWMEKVGKPRFLFTYLSVGACLLGLSGRNFE